MKNINKVFEILKKNNQNPTTELLYKSDFELLIAVILSAQATDISVNKATKELYKKYNTAAKILKLGEEGLKEYIKSIGLYNSKAKNIIAACKVLNEKYKKRFPNTREELEELPGVGRKTANVVLNTLYGEDTIAVDTHVYRVSKRIGLADAATHVAVEKQLMQVVPKKYLKNAHHWLILHGRYTCMARKPKCDSCVIEKFCEYEDKQ